MKLVFEFESIYVEIKPASKSIKPSIIHPLAKIHTINKERTRKVKFAS